MFFLNLSFVLRFIYSVIYLTEILNIYVAKCFVMISDFIFILPALFLMIC